LVTLLSRRDRRHPVSQWIGVAHVVKWLTPHNTHLPSTILSLLSTILTVSHHPRGPHQILLINNTISYTKSVDTIWLRSCVR
jgi:hypothetical protein